METELVTDGNIQHHAIKIIEIIKSLLGIPSANATVSHNTYYINIYPNGMSHNDRVEISYNVSTTINGAQLLNFFKTRLNQIGQITHDTNKTEKVLLPPLAITY